jgi:hypothetical protein
MVKMNEMLLKRVMLIILKMLRILILSKDVGVIMSITTTISGILSKMVRFVVQMTRTTLVLCKW